MKTQENNKTIAQVIKTQQNNKMIAEFMNHSHPFLPSKSTINYIAMYLEYDNDWNWSFRQEMTHTNGITLWTRYSLVIET